MATIKSCTDLEQSKTLSKILTLDSADMYYAAIINATTKKFVYTTPPRIKQEYSSIYKTDIPAWSLSALLEVIPQEIFDGEYVINITEGLDNKWILTYDHYENRNHSYYGLSTGADNLVDACTNIIIKLKERNII